MTLSGTTDNILRTLRQPEPAYFTTLACLLAILALGVVAFAYQFQIGLGVAGYQPPIFWAVYITNFVFWIGITHSGTLISAVLFLFRARWRTGVARAAEAMTVFAIMTGALFPIIHLGRPWLFYWLLPFPNERHLWVNFLSPIIWDLFAITTYLTVSIVFLYVGLLPDIATARDKIRDWRQPFYRLLSLGWSGSDRQWWHYNSLYGLLAALIVPLAISVHSIVSWDFATTLVPGWHSTIFAPYFVAGAILSGVAMMITLLIPMRTLLGLKSYIRVQHFDNLGKLLVLMSLIMSYAYGMEFFVAWYSGKPLRAGHVLDSCDRPVCAVDVDDAGVQHPRPIDASRQTDPHSPRHVVRRRDPRQHRDVARAVCHYRQLTGARFRPRQLDERSVSPNVGGGRDHGRVVCPVLSAVPRVRESVPTSRHERD